MAKSVYNMCSTTSVNLAVEKEGAGNDVFLVDFDGVVCSKYHQFCFVAHSDIQNRASDMSYATCPESPRMLSVLRILSNKAL